MAEVRQTSKGIMVRVFLGRNAKGKPIRKSKTFPLKTRQATIDKWIQKLEDKPAIPKPKESKPFDTVVSEYLEHKRYDLAPRTIEAYEGDFRRYITGKLSDVDKVTKQDIQALLDTYRHLSPKTQLRIKKMLSMVFNFAVMQGYIEDNPIDRRVRVAKQRRVKNIQVLSVEQYERVLNSCDNLGLLTLFYTGMRISELLALEPRHIQGSSIVIEQSLDGLGNNPRRVGRPKSESSYRTIPIPEHLAKLLCAEIPSKGFVFPKGYNYYKSRLEAVCEAIGVPQMTLHGIRHSHCTYLLAKDVNALAVSKRLGHHSVTFTLQTYGHLIPSMDDKLMQVLG